MVKAAEKSLYNVRTEIIDVPKYGKGRPKKGEARKPKAIEYELKATVEENPEKTEKIRLEADCFVLITNVPAQANEHEWSGGELLRLYKEQDGIEKNFGFLKDPAIVNAIFLKKPKRVEALGLILMYDTRDRIRKNPPILISRFWSGNIPGGSYPYNCPC